MPTHLPIGRLYPRHFFTSIFHPGRELGFRKILVLSSKHRANPSMRLGKDLKNSKENVPIMGFQFGCWFKPFATVYNTQSRNRDGGQRCPHG